VKILAATNVTGYPYAQISTRPSPGDEQGPLGLRVDHKKLIDMNAYLSGLEAPAGARVDRAAADRGEKMFRANCTTCHNVDQDKRVGPMIVPMKTIFPGDNPVVLAQREPPLNPVQDTPNSFFDDKMIVVNASIRKLERGIAIPLLLDLARKPVFLHDNSVPDLETLFDPKRGPNAPHPFYVDAEGGTAGHHRLAEEPADKVTRHPSRPPLLPPSPFRNASRHSFVTRSARCRDFSPVSLHRRTERSPVPRRGPLETCAARPTVGRRPS